MTGPPKTKRGRGPRALAAAVAGVTRAIFRRRGFAEGAIVTDWPRIVGPHLARHTAPERIVYGAASRREGVLHLRTDSGALATELQHLEPQLAERINTYFGYRAVARLRLVRGPIVHAANEPKPQFPPPDADLAADQVADLAERLAGIEDPELRAALESLGRVVMARASP